MKSLVKFAAAASVLSAAALTASAIPASAAGNVLLIGSAGNDELICTPNLTHGLIGSFEPFYYGVNGCGTRVWLHQFSNGSGWSYCISPNSSGYIPAYAQFPAQALVTANTAKCP